MIQAIVFLLLSGNFNFLYLGKAPVKEVICVLTNIGKKIG